MRYLSFILTTILLAASLFWTWQNVPEVRGVTSDLLAGKLHTLEIRHSAQAIMERHKRDLLKDSEHSFLEPDLRFHPYLLMEVKYSQTADKTGEGVILWSLTDGEMVINTTTWEKTHGFTDCLSAGADKNDFKFINALASKGGSADRETLSEMLSVENEILDIWVESCRKKNLIVQKGNTYRLHLQSPKMQVKPETKLDQWLVTKPTKHAKKIARRFRPSQIEMIAKSAFGNDFAIRKTTEIYLPVYSIIVQNPDGSQMTTQWNALNGQKLSNSFHVH
ncbi:MAG TPA: hypothetical protein P5048_03080 [Chlamydiales bacterium]|nr:hypothetical protein [Chlamydiales bacterium]